MAKANVTKTVELTVDIPRLLKQKQALVAHGQDSDYAIPAEVIDGLLNLLDYIHDELDPPSNGRQM